MISPSPITFTKRMEENKMNYYLGFDAGTQSVKVAVYDEDMNCIVSSSAPTTLTYPEPGWVSMDVDEYLALTIKGMKECASQMKEKGLDVTKIKSIMGDGVICGICGVDKDGNAITPYINYLDSRTKEDVELVNSWELDIFGKETGNPEANCMFPAMFARWFLKNNEAFNRDGVKFVHNAPYILMHLAGLKGEDAFIDWGAMSGWGLGYDVQKKCWSDEQLEILGIDRKYMPEIVKPWDKVGGLSEAMAERTGLRAGIPILGGAGDTMQSMLGSGNMGAGQAVDRRRASSPSSPNRAQGSSSIRARSPTPTSTGASSARAVSPCAGSRTTSARRRTMLPTTAR